MAYVPPPRTLKTGLLAALQSDPQTDPTPSTATDGMLIDGDPAVVQSRANRVRTNPIRSSMTNRKDIISRKIYDVRFDVILQGAGGSGGNEPFWVRLVRACGFAAASGDDGGSSSWILTPTNDPPAIAFYWHAHDVRRKIIGAFGNCVFNFPANDVPRINFDFSGTYLDPETGVSFPSITDPAFYGREVESEALTIGAYTGIIENAVFDAGAQRRERPDINSANSFYGFFHGDRDPSMRIALEQEQNLSNFNPESLRDNQTVQDLAMTHGTVASGSQFSIATSDSQLVEVNSRNREDVFMWDTVFNIQNDADDADMTLTVKEKI